jgi:hypothetical protein
VLPLLVAVLVPVASGCSRAVAGAARPAPPTVPVAAGAPTRGETAPPAASVTGSAVAVSAPARRASAVELQSDVLPDECLLDADELRALLGRAVLAPEQMVVARDDGSRSSSCYANAAEGYPTPLAAINVYRVRSGTPAEFVRAAAQGGRSLGGVGEAGALLDTAAGPTLQVAGRAYVVTVVVLGRGPDDDAWRAAGTAALARLPG